MSVYKLSGKDWRVKTFSLTTSFVDISLPCEARTWIAQSRGDLDPIIRRDAVNFTEEWTVKGNVEIDSGVAHGSGTKIVGQARVSSGTDTLEVLYSI